MSEERYVDWEKIGDGGTADVFRAIDKGLNNRPVAVKILKEKYSGSRRLLQGLRDEVLISRDLRHPNICPIHDIYEGPLGFGIVMDFIEGKDLRAWMDENHNWLLETLDGRIAGLRKIAEALIVAHTLIIHRDLKPSNIFLLEGDISRPLIMDFGISIQGATGLDDKLGSAGTLKYASPEQFLSPETVDRRADLFAFGIMAYELLTDGRVPPCSLQFTHRGSDVVRVPVADIDPPSHFCDLIPADLDRIVLDMLNFEPEQRPPSAQSVYDVLASTELAEPGKGKGADLAEKPETALIEEGDYFVGSGPNGTIPAEKPMRRVTLSAFELAIRTTTNAEYRLFCERTGQPLPPWTEHPQLGRADHPVVGITWEEAKTYADWIGGRLPSEIEWEVAAKGGEKLRTYPWGNDAPDTTRANIDGVCNTTTPVSSHKLGATPHGCLEMCGNVWEWCLDSWDENLYRQIANADRNPRSKTDRPEKSVRGGSFESFASMGRCAFRHHCDMGERRPDVGFRVAFDCSQTLN